MDDQTGLKILRDQVTKVKARGGADVGVASLDALIMELIEQAGTSLDERKLLSQHSLAQYDADVRTGIEALKATNESGREALNALLLINGGAVVSLLGFVGAMAAKPNGLAIANSMRDPLLRFGGGVLLAAVSFGVRYLAQFTYAGRKTTAGQVLNVISIALAVAGYVAFAWGLLGASGAIGAKGP